MHKLLRPAVITVLLVAIVGAQSGLTAHAGPDQNDAFVDAVVHLDGAASTGATTYAWAFQSRPSGSSAALAAANSATPSFTPDRGGTYVVKLTVGNGSTTATDTVSVTTVNRPPNAEAGADIDGPVSRAVTLDGTASSDPDHDKLTYQWTVVSAPETSAGVLTNASKSKARLVVDRPGSYVVQLIVNDGHVSSAADVVAVTTPDTAPLANAGPDRFVPPGTRVGLDGTASSDVDEQLLSYSWKLKKPSGSSAALVQASSPRPTFVADVAGSYVATLTVSDGIARKTDQVTITTNANLAPIARAGRDHAALAAGQTIVLDASGSSDANGDRLSYAWSISKRPGSSTATLGTPNAVRSTFTADVKGTYNFSLAVTDPSGAAGTDLISYSKALPVADAGPDQAVGPGDIVALDGSASSHFTGALAYGWALLSKPLGSGAALSDPADPQPQLVADVAGTYVAQLIVFDGAVLSAADTVVITAGDNASPRVDLEPDQVVPTNTIVTLDSVGTVDPDHDPLTFAWALVARPAASAAGLSAATGGSTQLAVDAAGAYVVQLSASDADGLSAVGTIVITTSRGRPAVSVGADRSAPPSSPIALSAVVSDPDGGSVTLSWRFLSTPPESTTSFSNPSSATPTFTPDVLGVYVVQALASDSDGLEAVDALVIRVSPVGLHPIITIAATDAAAESGADPGTFTFTRSGDPSAPLNSVAYTRSGSASPGSDYAPALPAAGTVDFAAGQAMATIVITPVSDGLVEGAETVTLTLVDSPSYDLGAPATQSATVTIADADSVGDLVNGATFTGSIIVAHEVDVWTFNATAGDRIGVNVGQISEADDFVPWIRLIAPDGTTLGSNWSAGAGAIDGASAPVTGLYRVLVASNDSGTDGAGIYRLTMTHTPGPVSITPGDEGGDMINGATYLGTIAAGDLDVYTFTAAAGDVIGVHVGQISEADDFVPWIRLWAPNGVVLGSNWNYAAANIDGARAPVTGTYLVLVASNDGGADGAGAYRLTMTHTPGPVSITPGDEGGDMVNGTTYTGTIGAGDLDVYTFTATAGDVIGVHVGQTSQTDDFVPWVRLWAPNGVILGSDWNYAAAYINGARAPVTGTYLVLVASNDGGSDGAGAYRVTMTHTPGPVSITPGDEGGDMVNGTTYTGTIGAGDLDVYTFTATAGDVIGVHVGQTSEADDFVPWVRLWAPNGVILGSDWNYAAAYINGARAPVTGTYLVLVASNDGGADGAGAYRLTMTHTPGPVTISGGDEGGGLTSGIPSAGTIVAGDLDVFTISAVAGTHISVHISETAEADDFVPWIRLWSPTGTILGSTWSATSAGINLATASTTGTYLVLVASNDGGADGAGSYSLTVSVGP